MIRWWKRRFDLFWGLNEGIRMAKGLAFADLLIWNNLESWWGVTAEEVAREQVEISASDVVVDAYAGESGNTIQFVKECQLGR